MENTKRNNLMLMVLVAFGLGVCAVFFAKSAYDNDLWFLLATGREIVENGIPYINPWTIHDGLETVIQQWIPAVILYAVHSAFGMTGIKVLVCVQICILMGALYALCRVCSGVRGRSGETFLIIIALAVPALYVYWSARPHLYTMIMFTLLLIVLETYRRTANAKLLVLLPVITCVHVNLHMAMAPFDLFVIALYAVPDVFTWLKVRFPNMPVSFGLSEYPRKQLAIALVVAGVAMLINPYGLKGALYLVESYGAADYGNYINEMGRASIWVDYGFAILCSTVLGGISIGLNGPKNINFPLTVLYLILIPLSLSHVRNVWLLSLFAIPLIAQGFGRISLDIPRVPFFSMVKPALAVACVCVAVLIINMVQYYPAGTIDEEATDHADTPFKAVLYLDQYVEEKAVEKSSLRIYNSFNLGGFVEYYGYRVFMDPRPELWEPGITGVDRHYYTEFVDFAQNTTSAKDVLEEYDFDFLICNSGSKLESAVRSDGRYERQFSGNDYSFWAKKELVEGMYIDVQSAYNQLKGINVVVNSVDGSSSDDASDSTDSD